MSLEKGDKIIVLSCIHGDDTNWPGTIGKVVEVNGSFQGDMTFGHDGTHFIIGDHMTYNKVGI